MRQVPRGLTSRLRVFLIVYGAIHVSQLANRLVDVLWPGQPSYALYLLQSLLTPLQGAGNAIAYGNSPRVRRTWAQTFPTLCGWAEPREADADADGALRGGAAGGRARRSTTTVAELTPAGGLRDREDLQVRLESPRTREEGAMMERTVERT